MVLEQGLNGFSVSVWLFFLWMGMYSYPSSSDRLTSCQWENTVPGGLQIWAVNDAVLGIRDLV